jgi:hypothetical protein
VADGVQITAGSGTEIATRNVTYSGDSTQAQVVGLVVFAGSDDAKTVKDVDGTDSTHALPVQHVGSGTNTSGQVTVTNSSTTIVSSGATRRGVLITNNQTVAVYLDPNGGSATTSNRRLDPGASIYYPVTTAVTGITSAAYTASGDAKIHYDTFAP